jgi:hypothetical protein
VYRLPPFLEPGFPLGLLHVELLQPGLHRGQRLLLEGILPAQPLRLLLQVAAQGGAGEVLAARQTGAERVHVVAERDVLLRFLFLFAELALLAVEFALQVLDAQQVLAGLLQLALRGDALGLVADDAGRLFHVDAALGGGGGDELLHPPLLDDGVGAPGGPRVHHELPHVHQPAGGLVDQVLALARAVEAARDRDLFVVAVFFRRPAVPILEQDGDFGAPDRLAGLAPIEDDVRHGLAAQEAGGLLAQHPADGVHHVALAAAVRPDHQRDAVILEVEDGVVAEGLEPAQLQPFQPHAPPHCAKWFSSLKPFRPVIPPRGGSRLSSTGRSRSRGAPCFTPSVRRGLLRSGGSERRKSESSGRPFEC